MHLIDFSCIISQTMLVLAEWAVARASLPKHLLEEQKILSFKLLSERFSESYCSLLRLRFILFSHLIEQINQLPKTKQLKITSFAVPRTKSGYSACC